MRELVVQFRFLGGDIVFAHIPYLDWMNLIRPLLCASKARHGNGDTFYHYYGPAPTGPVFNEHFIKHTWEILQSLAEKQYVDPDDERTPKAMWFG